MSRLDELWRAVKGIPRGKVMSYGAVGRLLRYPATGREVGRWMAQAPDGIPWWRVVAKDGSFPISKRGPAYVSEQEERLRNEGVPFRPSGRVDMGKASGDS